MGDTWLVISSFFTAIYRCVGQVELSIFPCFACSGDFMLGEIAERSLPTGVFRIWELKARLRSGKVEDMDKNHGYLVQK